MLWLITVNSQIFAISGCFQLFKAETCHWGLMAKVNSFCKECEFLFIKSYLNKYDSPVELPGLAGWLWKRKHFFLIIDEGNTGILS